MVNYKRKGGFSFMRWIPLQKADSKTWKLCVLFDDCMTYEVTSIESKHVDQILLYTAYMNDGIDGGIEAEVLEKLERLKKQYKLNKEFPQ